MSDQLPPVPTASNVTGAKQFPCSNCGAMLVWDPGTSSLKCPYCGTENTVPKSEQEKAVPPPVQREQDFLAYLQQLAGQADTVEAVTVRCDGCGSQQTLQPGQTAGTCAFCGKAIVAQTAIKRLIKPQSVLPFKIGREQAIEAFTKWLASRWFAPSNLKLFAERNGLQGVYVPAWTYDTNTQTWYEGQRGDDYWDTETYTETENGQTVTKTRQVKRTRWTWVSGTVLNDFDDVLVLAIRSLPRKADALEPWDLASLETYDDRYLSGFLAESYTIDLAEGFGVAQQKMKPTIDQTIRRDIGGDQQRIDSSQTQYNDITFKHLLLPMWISAYRYQGRVFNFLVNARTGQVAGDRPYSFWKIFFLVVSIVIVIATIVLIAKGMKHH
jgi:LSD1 subclass zinc finger protein